jgi:3-isopropylmalate/(R)-2-methylmalate dehydratase small subunit
MRTLIRGKAFVLGDDIDTDQIIPAQHLVYSLEKPEERKLYGRYALSGVPIERSGLPQGHIPFVREGEERSAYTVIIAGRNFGCGSSREHAPVALQVAGIEAVVATSYARIFYRNAIDGGFLVPFESERDLTYAVQTGDEVEIDVRLSSFRNLTTGIEATLRPLGDVRDILEAGGIFEYARLNGMI